jgi:pimeloyl-ACP methyl ester carboxylesterase
MIPGASGSAEAFNAAADCLAHHLTVVTYDRRGFSRSQIQDPHVDVHRLQTDVDDAACLLSRFGNEPAIVFGSSSGAIVALELLVRPASLVSTLVAHEPPLVKLLADGQRWIDFFLGLYQQYLVSGPPQALRAFRDQVLAESDRQALARALDAAGGAAVMSNARFWFEHELRQYPVAQINLDGLKVLADRIVPMVGHDSVGFPAHDATQELGKRLGSKAVVMPGGHLGFLSQPIEFADALLRFITAPPHTLRRPYGARTNPSSGHRLNRRRCTPPDHLPWLSFERWQQTRRVEDKYQLGRYVDEGSQQRVE